MRTLATLAGIYALFCGAGCALQRRMIYFPTTIDPRVANQVAARIGYQPWKTQAGELIGWKLPASGVSTGSVVVVHGNAGSALDRDYIARPIHEAGSRDVFILEYPGYGARGGAPTMKSILAAADEAFATLPIHLPVHVVSESLGTGVAAHLAKVHGERVAGLLMFVPYNNLVSVGQRQMPFLPVTLLLTERFDPLEWLKDYRGPVEIVIAGSDEVIPPDLGLKLRDGYAGPKKLQVIEAARHNDVAGQRPEWWREVFAFWLESATESRSNSMHPQ